METCPKCGRKEPMLTLVLDATTLSEKKLCSKCALASAGPVSVGINMRANDDRLAAKTPQSNFEAPKTLAEEGFRLAREGKLDEALKCFAKGYEEDPSCIDALYGQGAVHYRKRDFERAQQFFRCVLETDPSHERAAKYLQRCEKNLREAKLSGHDPGSNDSAASRRKSVLCSIGWHSWDGCKCSKCGATRDRNHDWSGCVCSDCGSKRDYQHTWDGKTCKVCGRIRPLSLTKRLRQGMTMSEVQHILGPPSGQMGGGDVLGRFGGVSGSSSALSSVSAQTFALWQRPEGEYRLVFRGNELIQIVSAPEEWPPGRTR